MIWRIKIPGFRPKRLHLGLALSLMVLLIMGCRQKEPAIVSAKETYHNPWALIETEELAQSLDHDHLKLIDFRKPEDYENGHIKGALNIWRHHLEHKESEVPGLLLPKQELQDLLGGLGIQGRDTLLIYDGRAGCDAARLWWALKQYGFGSVRILNGGIKAWQEAGGQLTIEVSEVEVDPVAFEWPEAERPELLISADTLLTHLNNPGLSILDVRSQAEYSGSHKRIGIGHAGRIPGSIHVDWSQAVNLEGDHRFRDFSALSLTYATFVQNPENTVVTYCHSGVRSAHTLFVLHELLGHQNVRNYDGSWLHWSNWEDAPFENDLDPVIVN